MLKGRLQVTMPGQFQDNARQQTGKRQRSNTVEASTASSTQHDRSPSQPRKKGQTGKFIVKSRFTFWSIGMIMLAVINGRSTSKDPPALSQTFAAADKSVMLQLPGVAQR
jgi:hypothetical protein